MRPEEVLFILKRVTYKPGWKLTARISSYTSRLVEIRWEFFAPCAVTGQPHIQICATHIIDPDYVDDEHRLMCDVRRSVERAEMHEAHEWLKLDGVAPFYPH